MEYTLKSNSLFIDKTGLLNGLQRGEELAFALLYNQYADLLYSYGTGLGFAKEDIEDSMQEVFCNLYLNHSKINEINNLKFYLLRALKNRLLNASHASKTQSFIDVENVDFYTDVTILDDLIDAEDRVVIQKKIQSYLDALTGRQREAIYLRYIEDLDYEEIAELMNMTVPSVRNLVFKAIKQLRNSSIPSLIWPILFSFVKIRL
ncbi:RNA polymerase sigma factor [Bacteroides sp. Marseille-P3684]|uniref:RNA polymerase sigma factor n=1 Tax=Bacteroides sp. Marseille-P3684 TaxID=2086579 RepID=UPI000D0EE1D0|nr:sigma-70 family RNA polymerase sigma factor [Bacteroides sp. Marseille-P3684]